MQEIDSLVFCVLPVPESHMKPLSPNFYPLAFVETIEWEP
jgi:hypothetical protein